MRAACFALAAVVLLAPAAHAQPAGIDPWPLVERWVEAIQAHEPGRDDEAARSVATMTGEEFEAAMRRMVFLLAWAHRPMGTRAFDGLFGRLYAHVDLSPGETRALAALSARIWADGDAFFERAAILHTDLTVFYPGVLLTSSEGTGQLAADGRLRGERGRPWHWMLARSFLHLALVQWDGRRTPRLEPDSNPGVRRWYQAVANHLWAMREYTEAVPHLERGLELFPDDAELLFVKGLVHEAQAGPQIQAAVEEELRTAARGGDAMSWRSVKPAGEERAQAGEAYRRALRADPGHQEARLHLAHLLTLDRKYVESADAIAIVLAREERPWQRYFAFLFLGRAEEGRGRPAAARGAYEAALALFPEAQAPRLALSQLDLRAGDRTAAARVFEFLARERGGSADPWWQYDGVRGPDGDFEWLERAREAFRVPAK